MPSQFLPLTERQRAVLLRSHPDMDPDKIDAMNRAEASSWIAHHSRNWRGYPPTKAQEAFLRSWCQWDPALNRGQASDLIGAIKTKAETMTPDEIDADLRRRRGIALGEPWW